MIATTLQVQAVPDALRMSDEHFNRTGIPIVYVCFGINFTGLVCGKRLHNACTLVQIVVCHDYITLNGIYTFFEFLCLFVMYRYKRARGGRSELRTLFIDGTPCQLQ